MLTQNPDAPLILIVEDDDSHAELIKRSFEDAEEAYRLEITGTLQAARTAIERQAPDLVMTDFRLPDGEGCELVQTVKGFCPVVLLTSHGNERVAVDAMKAGAHDYVVKTAAGFSGMARIAQRGLREWALIKGRIQDEKNIHTAKLDWERTFDAVPDLIAIIDLNHTMTRVNKAMADRCGLTPAELIGRKCHEVMHGSSPRDRRRQQPPALPPDIRLDVVRDEEDAVTDDVVVEIEHDLVTLPLRRVVDQARARVQPRFRFG